MPSEDLDLTAWCRKTRAQVADQLVEVEMWQRVLGSRGSSRRHLLMAMSKSLIEYVQAMDELAATLGPPET